MKRELSFLWDTHKAKNSLTTPKLIFYRDFNSSFYLEFFSYFFLFSIPLFLFMGLERLKMRNGGNFKESLFLLLGTECLLTNLSGEPYLEFWKMTARLLFKDMACMGKPGFGISDVSSSCTGRNHGPSKQMSRRNIWCGRNRSPMKNQTPMGVNSILTHGGSCLETISNIFHLIFISTMVS